MSYTSSPSTPESHSDDPPEPLSAHYLAQDWLSSSPSQNQIKVDNELSIDDLLVVSAFASEPAIADLGSPLSLSQFPFNPSLPPSTPAYPPPKHAFTDSTSSPPGPSSRRKQTKKSVPEAECSRVVQPPKEACTNLSIIAHNIPMEGAKSRVETQVKLTLALASSAPALGPDGTPDPASYDKVGSWPWIKLPKELATKKRARKDENLQPPPGDILLLSTKVVCASPPATIVHCCVNCQQREAKRAARRETSRAHPVRGESDLPKQPGKNRVIEYNSCDLLDFSQGIIQLPFRITCYCRHHKEKLGFRVVFTLTDSTGRVVGNGATPPIMITDDHKSPTAVLSKQMTGGMDEDMDSEIASRKRRAGDGELLGVIDKPHKRRATNGRDSRSNVPSRQPSASPMFTTAPPSPLAAEPILPPIPPEQSLFMESLGFNESPNAIANAPFDFSSVNTPPSLPNGVPSFAPQQPLPLLFPPPPATVAQSTLPKILRIIPASGPICGGSEITILGENFHHTPPLSCKFGDNVSTMTTPWSDNALVCILPASHTAGVVNVSFEGYPVDPSENAPVFTYVDDTDRQLMELTLRVLGGHLPREVRQAQNYAMQQLVGGNATSSAHVAGGSNSHGLLAPFGDLQSLTISCLAVLASHRVRNPRSSGLRVPLSLTTSGGQTMLHLAAILDFSDLVSALINHGIDIDVRDANGRTALHLAVLGDKVDCARILLNAGADQSVVDGSGRTAEECASGPMSLIFDDLAEETRSSGDEGDDELYDDRVSDDGSDQSQTEETRVGLPEISISTPQHTITQPGEGARRLEPQAIPSRPQTPTPPKPSHRLDEKKGDVGWIHRAFSHLQPPQGIIPAGWRPINIPGVAQLQLPTNVFPVFLIPALPQIPWPNPPTAQGDKEQRLTWAAYEYAAAPWRALQKQRQPPPSRTQHNVPSYPPSPQGEHPLTVDTSTLPSGAHTSSGAHTPHRTSRRPGYEPPQVTESEVQSYTYRSRHVIHPGTDRMLVYFWIPMFLLGLAWAMYKSIPFAFHTISSMAADALPLTNRFV